MQYNLFLDDDPLRKPHKITWIQLPLVEWLTVRNYTDFVNTILRHGIPNRISFDHDLALEHYVQFKTQKEADSATSKEKTGYDCAKWLAQYCIEHELKIPTYFVHSLNHIGKENIIFILESAKKQQKIKI